MILLAALAVIAGTPVHLECNQRIPNWNTAHYETKTISVQPWICKSAYKASSHIVKIKTTAWSLQVLAHESSHLYFGNKASERKVECRAIHKMPLLAHLLGINRRMGKKLQRTSYWLYQVLIDPGFRCSI